MAEIFAGHAPRPPARGVARWFRRLLRLLFVLLFALLALSVALFVYSRQFHPEAEDWPGQRALLATRAPAATSARIDATALLDDVRALSAPEMEGRKVGTPGGARARAYVAKRFAGLGLAPAFGRSYEQPFGFTPGRGIRFWRAQFWQARPPIHGVNLAGLVHGTVLPDRYLVVSAHYDHLGKRNGVLFPGADDNASGVAAMLAAAAWFRQHPPRHSILFVAFDAEEEGLRGARAFLEQAPVPLASILLNLNFDMISRNADGEIFLSGLHANPQLRPLVEPVRAVAAPTILYGHDHPRPFWDFEDWTQQSDHGEFAARGIPFLYLGVADHAGYHAPGDTFERIDQRFFLGVADSIVGLLSALDAADAGQLRPRGAGP